MSHRQRIQNLWDVGTYSHRTAAPAVKNEPSYARPLTQSHNLHARPAGVSRRGLRTARVALFSGSTGGSTIGITSVAPTGPTRNQEIVQLAERRWSKVPLHLPPAQPPASNLHRNGELGRSNGVTAVACARIAAAMITLPKLALQGRTSRSPPPQGTAHRRDRSLPLLRPSRTKEGYDETDDRPRLRRGALGAFRAACSISRAHDT